MGEYTDLIRVGGIIAVAMLLNLLLRKSDERWARRRGKLPKSPDRARNWGRRLGAACKQRCERLAARIGIEQRSRRAHDSQTKP